MNQLYSGDNLHVLREHIADESVDLIYLEPPFNSKRDYNLLSSHRKGMPARRRSRRSRDTWNWNKLIIGAAFGSIVTSLVKEILMPPLRLITGGLNFDNMFLVLKDAPGGASFATPAEAAKAGAVTMNYGNFLTLLITFLIVAFCIFLIVKALNNLKKKPVAERVSKDCPACAMTIPIRAIRCRIVRRKSQA